ncbi:MAG: hypothetical protein WKF84_24290 [Pyrinomonadaceae bacterium]
MSVTFVEVWERDQEGNELYHNSFVTDLEVTTKNVSEIISIGRAKWKIENEQFNIQKNHGYHLTHNFGHGQQNLEQRLLLFELGGLSGAHHPGARRHEVSKSTSDGEQSRPLLG